ncbi:MAG: pentapeptide repeat-containing protein [bacterium]|nr:pentapeptide repeat-containing protein [bacterium]
MSEKKCSYESCGRPIYQNPAYPQTSKCIFHCGKKDPQEFRDALASLIKSMRLSEIEVWDFSQFLFVDRAKKGNLFRAARFPRPVRFWCARFSGNANFMDATFNGSVHFRDAIFGGNANFKSASFIEVADFAGAKISGSALFRNTKFAKSAGFGSMSCGKADFSGTKFCSGVDFRNMWWKGEASFRDAVFEGNVSFMSAVLSGVQFWGTEFKGIVTFALAKLGGATFGKALFRKSAFFNCALFDGHVSFTARRGNEIGATFEDTVVFEETDFKKGVDFDKVTFPELVDFELAQFGGCACFRGVTFNGTANFRGTQFERGANFGCTWFIAAAWFNGDADFQKATFCDEADFKGVTFRQNAVFDHVIFKGTLNLEDCSFMILGDFSSVTISGNVRLYWPGPGFKRMEPDKPEGKQEKVERGRLLLKRLQFVRDMEVQWVSSEDYGKAIANGNAEPEKDREIQNAETDEVVMVHGVRGYQDAIIVDRDSEELSSERVIPIRKRCGCEPLLDLRELPLQDDCALQIHDCEMSRILLVRTDCSKIEFRSVQWPELNKRKVIGDEFIWRTMRDVVERLDEKDESISFKWNDVQITYQELAKRYREDLNHPLANDFERGIFEARLMAAKEKGDWKNAWLLRFYRWASDFSGSIWKPAYRLILVLLTCAVIYAVLLYGRDLAWSAKGIGNVVFKGLIAALRVASLDRGWFSTEVDWTVIGNVYVRFILSLVSVLQTILTASLITLFIFSVRRRFKHSE